MPSLRKMITIPEVVTLLFGLATRTPRPSRWLISMRSKPRRASDRVMETVASKSLPDLLISSTCENDALSVCHPTFNVNLLSSLFLDDFLPLAFLASL